jgi:hypothetical protein
MAKREPRWVAVFLKQLERTGNVRMAAEGAGVDFSTAYQRRKRHGDFAERWEGALARFKEAPPPLSAVPLPSKSRGGEDDQQGHQALTLPQPPAAPSLSLDGRGEAVLRPDGKVIKGSEARWGKRAEEGFLLELTVSGNVRRAAEAAGFSTAAVYKRRLKSRHFAAAWDAAVETGKARVQAYLVEAATRTFDPDELPIADGAESMKVSIGEAINIAKLPARDGGAAAGSAKGWGLEGRTYDETGFDTTPITREEWEQARQNIIDRLARIRERDEAKPKCEACGQPLLNERGEN